MSNHRRAPTSTFLPLLFLALTLAGCAGLDRPAEAPAGDWNTHRQQLISLDQWRAEGKVALRSAQGADSASLMWQQHGDNTDLLLSGPIGLGATRIHSDGKHLDINRGGELQRIDISSPDAIARATGWDLPLAALRHWLKGAPAPDLAIQSLDLDPKQGLLSHLRQADWDIHYQHYREFDGLRLPTRLHIKRGSTEARILIAQWQLPPDR
ncbi:MAG: outer membrane lipoprotein LolB [Halieaceae bacterium]|nr:outer membrane lipoprotein LolB [Halieaceae bacterium]